jgi:hypothetical protein
LPCIEKIFREDRDRQRRREREREREENLHSRNIDKTPTSQALSPKEETRKMMNEDALKKKSTTMKERGERGRQEGAEREERDRSNEEMKTTRRRRGRRRKEWSWGRGRETEFFSTGIGTWLGTNGNWKHNKTKKRQRSTTFAETGLSDFMS